MKGADAQWKETNRHTRKEGMNPNKNSVKRDKIQEVPERTNRSLSFDTTRTAQKTKSLSYVS
jgi:hypothetical protein